MKNPMRIYKKIVRLLLHGAEMTQKELSESLGVSPAGISRALGKLERAGLVARIGAKQKGDQKSREVFCLGKAFLIVLVYPSDRGFNFVSMELDGSDRREEGILLRPELFYDDNCIAAISEVSLRMKLLQRGGSKVFLGVIDDESRHEMWKSIGAFAVAAPEGLAILVNRAKGGTGSYIYADKSGEIHTSVICGGEVLFRPIIKPREEIEALDAHSGFSASLNAETVFVFARNDNAEELIKDRIRLWCDRLGAESEIVRCGKGYWEDVLRGVLVEKIIDL